MSKAKPWKTVSEDFKRFGRSDAGEATIEENGGKFGAGLIRGVSLITRGEAFGHGMWIDSEALDQVVELSQSESGLKSRFTHPSMSSDGMGRYLGRIDNVYRDGDQVFGDLHFAKSAHETPDGDLAEYVLLLVDEDPRAAGLSIVFAPDYEATDDHYSEHWSKKDGFQSPDELNEKNLPHVRIEKMRAADIVDEPAANPAGMFDAEPTARNADNFLAYVAGLTDQKVESAFGVDPDRAKQFFTRWLESRRLSLVSMEGQEVTKDVTQESSESTREEFAAELAKFNEAFGAENGSKWFTDGKSFEEALALHVEALETKLSEERQAREAVEEKLSEANARFESLSLGEEEELSTGAASDAGGEPEKKTFAEYTRSSRN